MTQIHDNTPPSGPAPGRRCLHCGYDLRGLPAGLCPECGREITSLSESPIPWVHRKTIGRVRAMRRTAWIATVRPRVLVEAATLPVDYPDAQLFRRIIIAGLWLSACVPIVIGYISAGSALQILPMVDPSVATSSFESVKLFAAAGYLFMPTPVIGLLITLTIGTTAAGFVVRPKDVPMAVRNRAVALTRYTLGPLAILPLVTAVLGSVFGLTLLLDVYFQGPFPQAIYVLAGVVAFFGGLLGVVLSGLYVFHTVRVAARVLHCGPIRMIGILAGMAAVWAGAIVLGLGLFPVVVGYGRVVLDSLR